MQLFEGSSPFTLQRSMKYHLRTSGIILKLHAVKYFISLLFLDCLKIFRTVFSQYWVSFQQLFPCEHISSNVNMLSFFS